MRFYELDERFSYGKQHLIHFDYVITVLSWLQIATILEGKERVIYSYLCVNHTDGTINGFTSLQLESDKKYETKQGFLTQPSVFNKRQFRNTETSASYP